METRWETGIYLGMVEESGEIIVGNDEGVKKGQSWARKPEDSRWDGKLLEEMKGVPWEPIPGRGMIQIKSKTVIPGESQGDEILDEPLLRDMVPRRLKITKYDLRKYGLTVDCPGCIAANRGLVANHSEKCRDRVEKLILAEDPDRYDKALERIGKGIISKDEKKKEEVEEPPKELPEPAEKQ